LTGFKDFFLVLDRRFMLTVPLKEFYKWQPIENAALHDLLVSLAH
jgi:hypothetical protein